MEVTVGWRKAHPRSGDCTEPKEKRSKGAGVHPIAQIQPLNIIFVLDTKSWPLTGGDWQGAELRGATGLEFSTGDF